MLEALKALLSRATSRSSGETAERGETERLRIAACALLLEMAHADDDFSAAERQQIERALAGHFALEAAQVREVVEAAEQSRRDAVDLHQFTSLIVTHYDEGQRVLLAELMWRVILADGNLSDHEDQLARKLNRLLDLRPGYLAEARRRATGG
jgi:uncharacterized tellurite resistance protein B-like protein